VIYSFADKRTRALFRDETVRRFATIEAEARRLLLLMEAARGLDDLRAAVGARLVEIAHRNNAHAILLSDGRQLCFRSREGEIRDVEITG
jgi:plasmid maintenance system killer protein